MKMLPKTQAGFVSMFIVISMGLVFIFAGLLYEGHQQLSYSGVYAKDRVAYYAAEAGLQRELCNFERGMADGYDLSGTVGSGFYHVTVTLTGSTVNIVSRGYYGVSEGGGVQKNIIKFTGFLQNNHVTIVSWEKMP